MNHLYVGLMSGTSLDGIDAVLASFDDQHSPVAIHRTGFTPFSDAIRALLQELLDDPRPDHSIAREVDIQLGRVYADAVMNLLNDQNCVGDIRAIGCHGQTILHDPSAKPPFSWQAGDAQTLATLTGIPVVDDFRRADIACGGQGAPLAPAFHQFAFSTGEQSIAVVNLGGIANVTYLPASHTESVI